MRSKISLLILMSLASVTTILAQTAHQKAVNEKAKLYKNSIPESAQRKMDKMVDGELQRKGGEKIGFVRMAGFKPLGEVEKNELEKLKKSFESLTPPRNNFKNNLGLIRRNIDVLDMAYEISGDIWFLNKMIECCDHMIDGQNGPGKYKAITGEYDCYWPTGFVYRDGEIYSNTALFSNGIIVRRLSRVAQRILECPELANKNTPVPDLFHLGKTYGERAASYVERSCKTLDYLVRICYDKKTGLMVYPEVYKWSSRPDFVGIAPAWNRYFMQGVGFMQAAQTLKVMGGDEKKVALYHQITQKMIDEFFSTVKRKEVNGKTAYWWPYNYYFSPDRPEDGGHAWFDIDLMMHFYRSQKYGINSEMMMPFANTYMEMMYQGNGRLSSNIDGSGKAKVMPGGVAWLHLLEFRPEIYEIMVSHYMSRQKMNGRDFGELLYAKQMMSQMNPNYKWKGLVDVEDLKNGKEKKAKHQVAKKKKRKK